MAATTQKAEKSTNSNGSDTNGRVVRLKNGRIIFPASRHDQSQTPDDFRRAAANTS